MNAPNFASVLDRPGSEIKELKTVPPGTYLLSIESFEHDRKGKNNNEFIEYKCRFVQAVEADAEALAEAGGLENRTIRYTFWLTEDAVFRLRNFLCNSLGLAEVDDDGTMYVDGQEVTLRDIAFQQTLNQQFIATISHRAQTEDKNGQPLAVAKLWAEIKDTAKV